MKGKQKRIRTRWPALLLCMGMVLTNVSPAAAGAVYAGNAKTVGDIPQSSMQASAESAKEAAANAGSQLDQLLIINSICITNFSFLNL